MNSQAETDFLDTVSERLSVARKEAGLTQERLAAKTDLDRVAIANIETGRRRPTVTTVYRLAQGLGIKLEDIFRGL